MSDQPIRKRWRDQPQAGPAESRAPEKLAVRFFRALKPVPRDPRAVSRLLGELVARAERGEPARPRLAPVLRFAIAALLLVSFGGALAAVHEGEWERAKAWVRQVVRETVRHSGGHSGEAVVAAGPEQVIASPPFISAPVIAAPGPKVEPLAPSRSRLREIHVAAPVPTIAAPTGEPAPSVSPPEDLLTAENSMLEQAQDALGRQQPQAALAALGTYRQRFPHGKLEYDADLAEVRAQVALGKDAPALAVLDRAIATRGFDTLPRSPDLSVLRAELLARTGDCKAAAAEFSRLLDVEQLEAGLAERAVYGRAICLGKLGQRAESRRALRDYLNRFPGGRFVAKAQDALDPLE